MATLTDSPDSVVPLSGCLAWTITKAAASGDEIKRIGYKLMEGANEIIGLSASDLDEFRGNFIEDCRGLVQTSIPVPGSGVRNETRFQKDVKLVYGDITIDDCESTVSVATDSSLVKVINGYVGFQGSALDLMTERPFCYSLNANSEDYVWLRGAGSVQWTWYNPDGTTETTSTSAPFAVNIIPLTPKAFQLAGRKCGMKVLIIQGGKEWVFNVGLEDCSDYLDLHWLEPLGSYSTISFTDYTVQTFGSSQVVDLNSICKSDTLTGVSMYNAGKRVTNVEGGIQITFRRKFANNRENLLYLSNLSKQRGAYTIIDGQRIFIEINPSGITAFNSDDIINLQVVGRIEI